MLTYANRIVVLCLGCSLCVVPVGAQEAKKDAKEPPKSSPPAETPPGMPDAGAMQDMMKKWTDSMTPGEHHKKLEPLVGEWDAVTKMWWAGPAGPPLETKGKSSVKWVLGGRFLFQEFDSEMPMPDPENPMKTKNVPHKGMGFTGYDNFNNVYVGTWVDNMTTGILSSRGGVSPDGKTFTFYSQMDEPMMDVHGRMVKHVVKIVDKDKHVFEIIDLHAGPDYKVVEVTYTRKK